MTVKELFTQVIANYEECITQLQPLYSRDNQWNKMCYFHVQEGICNHIKKVITKDINCRNIGKVLGLHFTLSTVCPFPKWTNTKELNIELLNKRISAMKKALELYPDEEI